jgi:PDZ domain-containing protein/aspartyl protease
VPQLGSRIAILLLVAQVSFGQAPSYRFLSDGAALNIPVKVIANGLVFVRAGVNDNPAWFILDNATEGLVVDRNYAHKISLPTSAGMAVRGGGSDSIDAGVVPDVRVTLPGLELTHRNLVAIELKQLEPIVGHTVDGIIGSRLFEEFVVAIDYERCLVSIYSPQLYRASGREQAFSVLIDQHGFPFIQADLALPGVEPINGSFLIDGGANTFADIYKPFSDAHHIPPSAMKLLDEPGTSSGGTTESRDGRALSISVGPYSVKNPPITFAQDVEGLMAAKDYAGLIGTEFLERFTVVFDNPGKRILLTPNGSFGKPAEYDESGLRIRAADAGFHKFVVTRIVPGSPATEVGIEPGDVLDSIDNRAAEAMTLTEIRSMLRRSSARYSIGILRGSRHIRVALQLRPLL